MMINNPKRWRRSIVPSFKKTGLVRIGHIHQPTQNYAYLTVSISQGFIRKGDFLAKISEDSRSYQVQYILAFGILPNSPSNIPEFKKRRHLEEVETGFSGVIYISGNIENLKVKDHLFVVKSNPPKSFSTEENNQNDKEVKKDFILTVQGEKKIFGLGDPISNWQGVFANQTPVYTRFMAPEEHLEFPNLGFELLFYNKKLTDIWLHISGEDYSHRFEGRFNFLTNTFWQAPNIQKFKKILEQNGFKNIPSSFPNWCDMLNDQFLVSYTKYTSSEFIVISDRARFCEQLNSGC